jgi:hypothetical protein
MSNFKWGSAFHTVNQELFDLYDTAKSPEEITKLQDQYLKTEQERIENKKNYKGDGLEDLDREIEEMERRELEEEMKNQNEGEEQDMTEALKNCEINENIFKK